MKKAVNTTTVFTAFLNQFYGLNFKYLQIKLKLNHTFYEKKYLNLFIERNQTLTILRKLTL